MTNWPSFRWPVQELQLVQVLLRAPRGPGSRRAAPCGPCPAARWIDLVRLLRLLRVLLQSASVKPSSTSGTFSRVRRLALQHLDVVRRQLPGPFQRRGDRGLLVRLGPLAADEVEAEFLALLQQRRDLVLDRLEPVVGLARQVVGAEDALRRTSPGRSAASAPTVLVGQVARQVDLVRRLHVEQGLGLVLDADLRDLERVDELLAGELEAGRRDFAGEGAVLVLLHLHGVDLHDGEEPLLLDVEVERRLVAGVAVLVVLEPWNRSSARSASMIL